MVGKKIVFCARLLTIKNSLGGEMVDTQDSKFCAAKRGGSSPLQGIGRCNRGKKICSSIFLLFPQRSLILLKKKCGCIDLFRQSEYLTWWRRKAIKL
jgi:hypothetical protein